MIVAVINMTFKGVLSRGVGTQRAKFAALKVGVFLRGEETE